MNLDELRKNYRDDILAIAEKYGADNVRVFGSIVHHNLREDSDIDLLVHFKPGTSLLDEAGLDIALNQLLNRKVDLIGEDVVRDEFRPYIFNSAIPL